MLAARAAGVEVLDTPVLRLPRRGRARVERPTRARPRLRRQDRHPPRPGRRPQPRLRPRRGRGRPGAADRGGARRRGASGTRCRDRGRRDGRGPPRPRGAADARRGTRRRPREAARSFGSLARFGGFPRLGGRRFTWPRSTRSTRFWRAGVSRSSASSRDPKDFSRSLFRAFVERGYDVVPVNANGGDVDGRPAVRRDRGRRAADRGGSPHDRRTQASAAVVRECAAAGVERVWLYRAAGDGAVSPEAVAAAREHGLEVVDGACPFMFLPGTGRLPPPARLPPPPDRPPGGLRVRPSLRLLDDAARRPDPRRGARRPRDGRGRGPQRRRDASCSSPPAPRATRAGRVLLPAPLVDAALRTAPRAVCLFDALGRQTHELAGDAVYFTPGLGGHPRPRRRDGQDPPRPRPTTTSATRRSWRACRTSPSQSTALIPADVAEGVADSWRLFLSLLLGEKPVVTGAFSARGLRGDARPAARGPRHRRGAAGAAAVRLLVLPDGAAQVELRDEPERDRLRARGRAGRVRLDAARRLRGPGDARRQRRAARGGDALRRRALPARARPARRSSGAARRPSSTCATRRRRWGRSRR